jgi:hypothetical protein
LKFCAAFTFLLLFACVHNWRLEDKTKLQAYGNRFMGGCRHHALPQTLGWSKRSLLAIISKLQFNNNDWPERKNYTLPCYLLLERQGPVLKLRSSRLQLQE